MPKKIKRPTVYQIIDHQDEVISQDQQCLYGFPNDFYYVKQILKQKTLRDGRVQLFVSWEGWPDKYNSWIFKDSLTPIQELVKQIDVQEELSNDSSSQKSVENIIKVAKSNGIATTKIDKGKATLKQNHKEKCMRNSKGKKEDSIANKYKRSLYMKTNEEALNLQKIPKSQIKNHKHDRLKKFNENVRLSNQSEELIQDEISFFGSQPRQTERNFINKHQQKSSMIKKKDQQRRIKDRKNEGIIEKTSPQLKEKDKTNRKESEMPQFEEKGKRNQGQDYVISLRDCSGIFDLSKFSFDSESSTSIPKNNKNFTDLKLKNSQNYSISGLGKVANQDSQKKMTNKKDNPQEKEDNCDKKKQNLSKQKRNLQQELKKNTQNKGIVKYSEKEYNRVSQKDLQVRKSQESLLHTQLRSSQEKNEVLGQREKKDGNEELFQSCLLDETSLSNALQIMQKEKLTNNQFIQIITKQNKRKMNESSLLIEFDSSSNEIFNKTSEHSALLSKSIIQAINQENLGKDRKIEKSSNVNAISSTINEQQDEEEKQEDAQQKKILNSEINPNLKLRQSKDLIEFSVKNQQQGSESEGQKEFDNGGKNIAPKLDHNQKSGQFNKIYLQGGRKKQQNQQISDSQKSIIVYNPIIKKQHFDSDEKQSSSNKIFSLSRHKNNNKK